MQKWIVPHFIAMYPTKTLYGENVFYDMSYLWLFYNTEYYYDKFEYIEVMYD